jgi:hypothetical protein
MAKATKTKTAVVSPAKEAKQKEKAATNAAQAIAEENEKRTFVVIFCPVGEAPTAHSVIGLQAALKALRASHACYDQQYAFIVRGELGRLWKGKNKLSIAFGEEPQTSVLLNSKKKELKDGWLGD